ncbi:aminoacetone oxidase family FAD-binding enzyme [candidate division WOR-3 bacterium]|nr:aminoacetone oxidase family FAD-binding enzyme [candidate division WOR-3 bacterium]
MVVDLVVVGGGAGGLACGLAAARLGLRALVLEKTDRCGHKLALTGGRKGNFTHEEPPRAMASRFDCDPGWLLPLLRRFPHQRVVQFFGTLGVEPRTDADGCVWPKRTDAAGLRDALVLDLERAGGTVRTHCRVTALEPGWTVALAGGERIRAASVVLATGGASYPQTGSTGDGLGLAQGLGLATTPWFAALASLRTRPDPSELAGITQPRVRMELLVDGAVVRETEGHFIFAHGYVSGSSVLNLCGHAARALPGGRAVVLRVDWTPGRRHDELMQELDMARKHRPRARLATVAAGYVSRRLAARLAQSAELPPDRTMANLGRGEVERIARQLKATEWEVTGAEPLERATVTGGGVRLDEVDPGTMQAKRFPGLYCVGEVLDTWAESGGYNLHFAWATGIAAAEAVSRAAAAGRGLD